MWRLMGIINLGSSLVCLSDGFDDFVKFSWENIPQTSCHIISYPQFSSSGKYCFNNHRIEL
jgi:hypothetical protein